MTATSAAEEAEQTLRRARRGPLWSPGPDTRVIPPGELPLTGLIPHRPPFLLVDAINVVDLVQGAIAGERTLAVDDPVAGRITPLDQRPPEFDGRIERVA